MPSMPQVWQDVAPIGRYCQCPGPPGDGILERMDAYKIPPAAGQRASWIVCLARRIHDAVSEINYATRRANALMLTYGLAETDRAPDTYAEFLLRSSATTLHEPPARRR